MLNKIVTTNKICLIILLFGFIACKVKKQNKINSAYERVKINRVLRAAFTSFYPYCVKDNMTGKITGISAEILTEICNNLDIELVWTDEVSWDLQMVGLHENKFDIVGTVVWSTPNRITTSTLTTPVFTSNFNLFVRENEHRFDKIKNRLDSSLIKFGIIDGDVSSMIFIEQYPKAQKISFPSNTNQFDLFTALISKRCDVVIADTYDAVTFMHKSKLKLKNISSNSPVRVFRNCFMMKPNEFQLKQMFDVVIQDLINQGYMKNILKKYELDSNSVYN